MQEEKRTVKSFPISYDLHLISGGKDIIFWGNDLKIDKRMEGTSKSNYSIFLDLHDGRIAGTKDNGEIDIINIYALEIEFILPGHKIAIVAICGIDTGNIGEHIIATAGAYDHSIRVWNLLTKECIREVNNVGDISALAFDIRRGYLMYSIPGSVIITDYKTLEIVREIVHGPGINIFQVLQINEDVYISICNSAKLSLKLWNIDTGETIQNIILENSPGFTCGALLDKNTLLLGETHSGKVLTYYLKNYNDINNYQIHQEGININQICILNQTEVISCSTDNTAILFDIKTGDVKFTLNRDMNEIVNTILPILFVSHSPKEYIIQIGEYTYNIKAHLLHRIAPTLRFNIHRRAGNIIQIEYIDSQISFNHLFMPFIDDKLIISEDNLAEAIILGKYFPMIKIQYEWYIKQHSASIIELFDKNKANPQLWNSRFAVQAQDESKLYIYIYIEIFIKFHDENLLFMADKMNFCEGTSLSFWESIEYENSQKYYILSNKTIIKLENQVNSKKNIKEGYESIKKYLKGEEITINSSNYSYLLSFAYYEKIQKLREICDEGQKNIFIKEQIEKQNFHSHFDSNTIYLISIILI